MIAAVTALFTVLFREPIALLYNDNPEVVIMASGLMLFAGIYQLSDSVQVIGAGVPRGYKDTRHLYVTFTALLDPRPAVRLYSRTDRSGGTGNGPAGFWIGFIIGLTAAAIGMACGSCGYRNSRTVLSCNAPVVNGFLTGNAQFSVR